MRFDYNVYYRQNCIMPILFILLVGFLAFKVGVPMMKNFTHVSFSAFMKKSAKQCIFLFVCLFLVFINGINLFRGGFFLLIEKEDDAVEISGVIEKTIEIDALTGSKYGTENNYGRGEGLLINGEKYYLTTYGNLKPGDKIIAKVLPKSRFVLEIEKLNTEDISVSLPTSKQQ